jgi:hypothetical protein
MVSHNWGDENVDWEGISDAASYIGCRLIREGRVPVTCIKEKYGTVRVYCGFGWHSLLSITHPNYCHYGPYPEWLMHLDIYYLSKIISRLPFVRSYHRFTYRRVYAAAVKKWPHLREEILTDADWPEELKGL